VRAVRSTIERRLLVNWRADPVDVAPMLPTGFRPNLVDGSAVVGVCILRLEHVRPPGLPRWAGAGFTSAAHRVSVSWDGRDGREEHGVYVLRRDTSSRLAAAASGRLFPGELRRAEVTDTSTDEELSISVVGDDGASVVVHGLVGGADRSHLFPTPAAAERFFLGGAVAYSPRAGADRLDALDLDAARFDLRPVTLDVARSTIWHDIATFDGAYLMRDVAATWRAAS
jgi:hypothetical protein